MRCDPEKGTQSRKNFTREAFKENDVKTMAHPRGARGAIAPLRLSRPLKILNVTPQVTNIYIQLMLSTKSA